MCEVANLEPLAAVPMFQAEVKFLIVMGHDWSIVGIRCRTFSSAGNQSRMGVQI